MASKKPTLTVILSPSATEDLWNIWRYNIEEYKDIDHADRYLDFLKIGINTLATAYDDGDEISGFLGLRSLLLKKGRRGHGHYVIYEVDNLHETVHVHHIFHSRMDVQGRLRAEHGLH